MSASLNKYMIIGNLGRDPEYRETESGRQVCNFSVATTTASGETKYTEWHRVVVWGNQAEHCAKYLRKGSQVYAEGEHRTRKYKDKHGVERQTSELIAQRVQFLSKSGGIEAENPFGDDDSEASF